MDVLEAKERIPGTVNGYCRDEEYPLLQDYALGLMKERYSELDFPTGKQERTKP